MYSSPSVKVGPSKEDELVGHLVRTRKEMQTCEQTRTKDTCHPSADLSWGGGAMILEWIFNRMGGCGLDLSSITIWTSDRLLWAE